MPRTLRCAGDPDEDCDKTILNEKWEKIRSGWIFVNQQQFCPDHLPEWYHDWVAEKLMRKLETQLNIRIWTKEYGGD
jgi:hypothetical protein